MTSAQFAKAFNVSRASLFHAQTVLRHGSPELIAACDAGQLAVSRAAAIAKQYPKEQQIRVALSKQSPNLDSAGPLKRAWLKADEAARLEFVAWLKQEASE
jgi:hypothetical protein